MKRQPDGYVHTVNWLKHEVMLSKAVGGPPDPQLWIRFDDLDADPSCGFHPGSPLWFKPPRAHTAPAPVATIWRGFDLDAEWGIAPAPAAPLRCTCGTQIVGGLCSSWCDLVRPPEPEEAAPATEPSPVYSLIFGFSGKPVQPTPMPTLSNAGVADGTSADDVICKCGAYIIKHKSVHHTPRTSHGQLACTLTPAKP